MFVEANQKIMKSVKRQRLVNTMEVGDITYFNGEKCEVTDVMEGIGLVELWSNNGKSYLVYEGQCNN